MCDASFAARSTKNPPRFPPKMSRTVWSCPAWDPPLATVGHSSSPLNHPTIFQLGSGSDCESASCSFRARFCSNKGAFAIAVRRDKAHMIAAMITRTRGKDHGWAASRNGGTPLGERRMAKDFSVLQVHPDGGRSAALTLGPVCWVPKCTDLMARIVSVPIKRATVHFSRTGTKN